MLGLGSLKDKIANLGEGLKSQFSVETEPVSVESDLCAGSAVLTHYQSSWREIHSRGVAAGKEAERCDRAVARIQAEYERQVRHVGALSSLVTSLPDINNNVQQVMLTLGHLENLFMEVEVALLALEDTIDAREAQEKQLEQRFQMAIYQERRRQEIEELESRLEMQYQKRMKEKELAENLEKRERQAVFQAKFEEDMSRFSQTGRLEVPLTRPTDVSLESIDLDADDQNLELFLKEDCPGASPLPRDDIPLRVALSPSQSPAIKIQTPSEMAGSVQETKEDALENIDLN